MTSNSDSCTRQSVGPAAPVDRSCDQEGGRSGGRSQQRRRLAHIALAVTLPLLTLAVSPVAAGAQGPATDGPATELPTGQAPRGRTTLYVKLLDTMAAIDTPGSARPLEVSTVLRSAMPDEMTPAVDRIGNLFTLPTGHLNRLQGRRGMVNLSTWMTIEVHPAADPAAVAERLARLPIVEAVELAPAPPPLPLITPDLSGNQGYLEAAPNGIGAEYSWTVPGGTGSGVTIFDVEYSWNQDHEDLDAARGVALLLPAGDTPSDPFNSNDHGTAVLGELVATNDSLGVTGISYDAAVGLAPANTTDLGYNPANAILLAANAASPGDVILIEQQTQVCGTTSYGPSEWSQPVFDAIQVAVANGIVVVEAAGNGGVDLDQASCNNAFNRATRDSGAIIVGAGDASDPQRLGFSSYGSRVDVQGWGQSVATTGYGFSYTDPDTPADPNQWYTDSFSGTSSASPIVAGAVANLQGIAKTHFGAPLTPDEVRELLRSTGTPQQGDTSQPIGPRPDLRAAITELLGDTDTDTDTDCASLVEVGAVDGVLSAGDWYQQTGGGPGPTLPDDTIGCYLEAANQASSVFSEEVSATEIRDARQVLLGRGGATGPSAQLDRQLLAAWLNLATGSISADDLVDTDRDRERLGDTTVAELLGTVEAARLTDTTDATELRSLADLLTRLNNGVL